MKRLFISVFCLSLGFLSGAALPGRAGAEPPVAAPASPGAGEKAGEATAAVKLAPTPEAIAQGKALLAATVKAHGGEAFLGVTSLKATGKGSVQAPEQAGGVEIPIDALTLFFTLPDKARIEMETGFGSVVAGKPGDGKAGWVQMGGQVKNDANDNGVGLIPVTLLVRATKENFPVAALSDAPMPTADGKKLKGFSVTDAKGREYHLYVEEDASILRRVELTTPAGVTALEISPSKPTSGVLLPGGVQLKQGGKTMLTFTFFAFEVNPKLEDTLFQRPGEK